MKRPAHVLFAVCLLFAALPLFAGDKSAPDLDGQADLIISPNLGQQWVVREENLSPTFCSVIEGDVQPGIRKLIRFTVTTPNIGDADIYVGDPNVHIAANDGLFEFALCHNHFHFRHYAKYELVDPNTGKVWRAAKRGFCMLDTDPNPSWMGESAGPHFYRSCGLVGVPGNQGISHGWSDTYRFFLGGQYFVLDGGDGQEPVPPGDYMIRITVNPPFVPQAGERCPYRDTHGFCHQLPESNYDNNVGVAMVSIPAHPGRDGVGPLKNEKALAYEPTDD